MESINNAAAAVGNAATNAKRTALGQPSETEKAKNTVDKAGDKIAEKTKSGIDSGESKAHDAKESTKEAADKAEDKTKSAADTGASKVKSGADTAEKKAT